MIIVPEQIQAAIWQLFLSKLGKPQPLFPDSNGILNACTIKTISALKDSHHHVTGRVLGILDVAGVCQREAIDKAVPR